MKQSFANVSADTISDNLLSTDNISWPIYWWMQRNAMPPGSEDGGKDSSRQVEKCFTFAKNLPSYRVWLNCMSWKQPIRRKIRKNFLVSFDRLWTDSHTHSYSTHTVAIYVATSVQLVILHLLHKLSSSQTWTKWGNIKPMECVFQSAFFCNCFLSA